MSTRVSVGRDRIAAGEHDILVASTRAWAGQYHGPGLVYAHGLGGTAYNVMTPAMAPGEFELVHELAKHFPVSVGELGGTQTMGNDLAVTRTGQALDLLENQFGCVGPHFIVGASMGTFTACSFILNHPERIKAAACVVPAFDLAATHTEFPSNVDPSYPPDGYNEADFGATHNPMDFCMNITRRISAWYPSDDLIASPRATLAMTRNSLIKAHSVGALGHTEAAIAAATPDLVAWLTKQHV